MQVEFVAYSQVFLEKSWEWLNEPEIKLLTNTPDFSKEEQQAWFRSLPGRRDYKIWGVTESHKPIGVLGLKNITEHKAEYWGYIGEKEYLGKKIGPLMVAYAIEMAKEMKLQGLYLKVIPQNQRAIKLYEKMNFNRIGEENNLVLMQLTLEAGALFN